MLIFTNFDNQNKNDELKSIMKSIINEYKELNKNVRVIDANSIISIDYELLNKKQRKILESQDFILRKLVDIDMVLNRIRRILGDETVILTISWIDIIESIIINEHIEEFNIDNIKKIFLVLNSKIKEYFDIVAESTFKDIIKNEIDLEISTIHFKSDSTVDLFVNTYNSFANKYEDSVKDSLINFIHYLSGYANHKLFKNNIKLL